jgi:cyclase
VAIDAKKLTESRFELDRERDLPEWLSSKEYEFLRIETSTAEKKWEVYTHGGRRPRGIDVVEWAKFMERLGAGEILLTSMDRDGTKDGYDIELTRAVAEAVGIPVIASGGAGTLEHLYEALTEGKADAALAASIFHYREYTIRQCKEYLRDRGVVVRL